MNDLSQDLASLRIDRGAPKKRSPWITAVVVLFVLGAAALGAYSVLLPKLKAQFFKTEVSVTEIALVSPAQAQVTVTSTGYVVPQTISKVGAKVSGRVAKVNVKEGDTVKAGAVIATLDQADQQSSVAAAESRVAVARAQAATARANLADMNQQVERERRLVASGAMGRASLEDLEAKQKSLEEQVHAAEAQSHASDSEVGTLRANLQDFTIVTPIGGTIVSKPVEAGELVGPGTREVAEIADFGSLLVETDVPEGRLHLVTIGGPTEIVLDAYPEKRYRGQTVEFGQRVNRAKATVTVKVKFVDADGTSRDSSGRGSHQAEGVLPDMAARVSFLSKAVDADAIKAPPKKVVPASALAERGGAKNVFVIESGKLKMMPVTVGAAVGSGGFELVEGPPPGTRVVQNPDPALADGMDIKEKGGDG